MHLPKLWNKSKGPAISLSATTAALIGGLWSFDFQKLSPNTTLSSQTIYDIRVRLTLLFLLILAFLLLCVLIYSLVIIVKDKKSFRKELADTVKSIKETVENNYTIHQRETLSPSIEKAMNEEASRGLPLPQGSLAGRLFDIYLNEISIFSSIILEVSLSFASNYSNVFSLPELIGLFKELLIAHNAIIKKYHNCLVTDLFTHGNSTHTELMVDHFNKQADVETKLRCKELLSALKIKDLSTCAEMIFPPWEPIQKEKSKPHIFIEESKG
jgi:hypothetical protein